MAEETKKTDAPAAAPPAGDEAKPEGAKPKKKMFMIGLFGGVMLVEAVGIFMAMKMFGSEPHPVEAEGLTETTQPTMEIQEIEVANVRVPHVSGSRTTVYSMRVVATVEHEKMEAVKAVMESKKWTVIDTVSRVIRQAAETELSEPRLETLRRKMKFELNELCGEESAIEQVLIPECMPLTTGL